MLPYQLVLAREMANNVHLHRRDHAASTVLRGGFPLVLSIRMKAVIGL